MALNVHSDASYLSAPKARSKQEATSSSVVYQKTMSPSPSMEHSIFYVLCSILKLVASSAAEAELGALLLNEK